MKRTIWVGVVSLVLAATACGGDDSPATNSKKNNTANSSVPDMGTNNAANNENDVGGDVSCTPLEVCPDDSCGLLDDGCAGTLDCGACACEGGQPIEPSCGPCGLGSVVCSSDTEGDCEVPEIVEGLDCESILFVENGAVNGDGNADTPYGTLADALAEAEAGDTVIVAVTTMPYEEQVVLKDGVHISGGFERNSKWEYDESVKAAFRVETAGDEDVIGIAAEGLTRTTILENLAVETGAAPTRRNNYGLLVTSTLGLEVRRVDVRTGRGGDGETGGDGAKGADGSPGAPGGSATLAECGQDIQRLTGAPAGENPSCPASAGGDGGHGMASIQGGTLPATPGMNSPIGTQGGIAGIDFAGDRDGGLGSSGTVFTVGADDGDRGMSAGDVEDDRWVAMGNGVSGNVGSNGPGGGGGGGAARTPGASNVNSRTYGVSGGSGGAGGCGGTGGQGGTGGGGSFGVFLVRSDVEISSSSFIANAGGGGGNGGDGGLGGQGGVGGTGVESLCGEDVSSSGAGGDGAAGQVGGSGGGGAGGVSYGGYCFQSQPRLEDVAFTSLGSANGGRGGQGASEGQPGVSEDQFRCQ